jgi:hypothetical protein
MHTTTIRALIAIVAAPVAAGGILAGALGLPAVAEASVTPGVNEHTSGMVLSKEYLALQKEEHDKNSSAIDAQTQQEEHQPDSPAGQERLELKGDLKAEEMKLVTLKTVESPENDQPAEPEAHVYAPTNSARKHLGLMKGGWSQTAR